MKNILCFGDSNTYGLKPDGTGRYDSSVRYPCKLQNLLGDEYHIIEEGLPGRTTVFEDENRPFKKGIDYIVPCVQSHNPLDYVIIMLGTNDCKTAYNASADEIALGLTRIVDAVKSFANPPVKILIVSPIHLGEHTGESGFDPEFNQKSVGVSHELAAKYQLIAKATCCAFLDASKIATASQIDQEHLDASGHHALANAVAQSVLNTEEYEFQITETPLARGFANQL